MSKKDLYLRLNDLEYLYNELDERLCKLETQKKKAVRKVKKDEIKK